MDPASRLYALASDEANVTLLLFATAALLGLASVLSFFFTPGGSPTRFQLGLLVAAMVVVFYTTIRSATFE